MLTLRGEISLFNVAIFGTKQLFSDQSIIDVESPLMIVTAKDNSANKISSDRNKRDPQLQINAK